MLEPDYMCLKAASPMAQVTIGMDQEGPENPLQGKEEYFDSSAFVMCWL